MYYEIGGELYHHGVLGQKWGKRNGPPYPLKPHLSSKEGGSSIEDRAKKSYKITSAKYRNAKTRLKREKLNRRASMYKNANSKLEYEEKRNTYTRDPDDIAKVKDKNNKKIERLERKINKLDIKDHAKQAKIEKMVSKYMKKYALVSVKELDNEKIRKVESKVQKTIAKTYKIDRDTKRTLTAAKKLEDSRSGGAKNKNDKKKMIDKIKKRLQNPTNFITPHNNTIFQENVRRFNETNLHMQNINHMINQQNIMNTHMNYFMNAPHMW